MSIKRLHNTAIDCIKVLRPNDTQNLRIIFDDFGEPTGQFVSDRSGNKTGITRKSPVSHVS